MRISFTWLVTTSKEPSRMDQYVRVSRVAGRSGESFSSPKLQREQGPAWTSSRGVEVTVVHEDLDQSGGKMARPGLDALMARIGAGETDGVIVSKLDRLSRLGVADALRLVEQITEAGGSIAALAYLRKQVPAHPSMVSRVFVANAAPIIEPGAPSPCGDCCATAAIWARRAAAIVFCGTHTRPS
jgi:hypothetical protein